MISCPIGAIVRHGEIATLLEALADAVDWNESILAGEVVESRMRTDKKMRATYHHHTSRVKRFSALKRQLKIRVHPRSSAAKRRRSSASSASSAVKGSAS